jgi:hypothetical protein
MSWEINLRTRVKMFPQVSALTNSVDWTERPARTSYPAVVLELIFEPQVQVLSGTQDIQQSLVQFSLFGITRASVVELRKAVILAIQGPFLESGTQFQRTMIDGARGSGQNSDTGFVHSDVFDALFTHN